MYHDAMLVRDWPAVENVGKGHQSGWTVRTMRGHEAVSTDADIARMICQDDLLKLAPMILFDADGTETRK
jgi:hypothetical protein